MGRYFINVSRLDMVLIITALEDLKSNLIMDWDTKECRALQVLIDILKQRQDGSDPKVKLPYKDSQETNAMVMTRYLNNVLK